MKPFQTSLIFLILLFGVSSLYNYQNISFERPQSVHKWRQADCASIALNYHQNGMDFFHPETHNLTSDGGTTGSCCTSEIPILYFSVAGLYHIFGQDESVYRIFNSLLFFLGLFFLFRLLNYLLKDTFWSIALSLLFFTSPVLVYYGNNFLSNSTALSFSLIAWYYFVRFYFERRNHWFYKAVVFFGVAGALKVTALFSPLAIIALALLELLGVKISKSDEKLFSRPLPKLAALLSVLVVIVSWLFYARGYNQAHDCTYFSTTTFPIWGLDKEAISDVWHQVQRRQLTTYFHPYTLVFLAICLVFFVVRFRHFNKLFAAIIILVFAEITVYVLLQYWTFANHDYYTINMFILPVLLVIACFDLLHRNYTRIFNSRVLKISFLLFLVFNIYHARTIMESRYDLSKASNRLDQNLHDIRPWLRELGITPQDTVISIPDDTHLSLYLMNQKGWTEYIDTQFNRGEKKYYNKDRQSIQTSIDLGAKYMIVNGISELYRKQYLAPFCTNLVGNLGNVYVFDLVHGGSNFHLKERGITQRIYCDAERISKDGQHFFSGEDGLLFQGGNYRSSDFAHSGEYSCKLSADDAFGMTYTFSGVKPGDSFAISIWRKSSNHGIGKLVISSPDATVFEDNYEVLETDSAGWQKLYLEVFISDDFTSNELKVYALNPHETSVYFDDLEVIRYKP